MINFLNKSDEKVICTIKCSACDITEVMPIQLMPRSNDGNFLEIRTYQCARCWSLCELYFQKQIKLIKKREAQEHNSSTGPLGNKGNEDGVSASSGQD